MSQNTQSTQQQNRFQDATYRALKKSLTDTIKKVGNYETRKLPEDTTQREARIQQYTQELTGTYNNFVVYLGLFYDTFDLPSQFNVNESIEKHKVNVRKALNILKLDIDLPQNLNKFDINTVKPLGPNSSNKKSSDTLGASSSTLNNQETSSDLDENDDFQDDIESHENIVTEENISDSRQQQQINSDLSGNSLPSNNQNTQENNNQNLEMALSPGDILKGIPDFDSKSQDNVKKFIAQVDLMNLLAPNSGETILAIVRAKLVTANKLSSISDKTWAQIKADIESKYRMQMSYEVAQEKLLSVQQGPKESHDAYAKRVRDLLDALNAATINNNADIQKANRDLNEGLAVRKFKQNIYDRELRTMAITAEHTTLADAIAHTSIKFEQLQASNINKKEQEKKETEKKESDAEKSSKNSNEQSIFKPNKNKYKYQNKNKNDTAQCAHCKKSNHPSDQCFFRPGGAGLQNKNNNNEQSQTKSSNTAAAMAQPSAQNELPATTSSVALQQAQSMTLQPYHFLN